ncbi:MAG: nucleotidyltransferase domain-containing protein [Candidatus Methanoperedens sp.]|nr:nucleotidyltransferase domain-containing protein [Candidatus Methanoperedens sp.]
MIATEEKSDLNKIVNAILKEISSIEAIYLFGSIAKGKENERSDYDIAVIVREYPEKDLDIIARKRYSLLGKIKRPLEILLIGMDDLEYSSPFLYEIYHASRLLYGTDILIRAKKIVNNIRPIIAEGNKVGYHV